MATLLAYGKKVIGNLPFSASASDISYDNTSSGLSSTNVKDAIDELAGYKKVVSIPTSPTETYADGLTAMMPYYNALSGNQKVGALLRIGSLYLPSAYSGGGFSGITLDTNYVYMIAVRMNTSEYSRIRIKKSDLTMTYIDYSSRVRGDILELFVKN